MDVNTFVKSYIENKADYVLTEEDKKTTEFEGLSTFIYKKLNSSKYRASATAEDYVQKIKDKIDLCLNHEIPIHISLPFGATKNPHLPTAPAIDWAEVFNLGYMREYLKPIAAAYKHGVILEYVSVAVFEEKTNRIPIRDTDIYEKQFRALSDFYRSYLPGNFELRLSRVEDTISRDRINTLMDKKMNELRRKWNKQTPDEINQKIFRAKRNCIYDPADPNASEILTESALGHDSFCSECWTTELAPWDKKYMITLGHTYTAGWAIHVRSAPGSTINFWSGIGVLSTRGEEYVPTVLSLNQYGNYKKEITNVKVDFFDGEFTNLQEVPVLKS